MVQVEPVQIIKDGPPIAVAMSIEEHNRFKKLENFWWHNKTTEIISDEGYLSSTESDELLDGLLKVKK
jgi:hypothetical protein